jgi:glycine cleavage system H lipoate-binding protein
MEAIDIFATKGAEYLFCGGFLLVLTGFWWLLNPRPRLAEQLADAAPMPWFRLKDGALFHQGHGWVLPVGGNEVLVGMDDFAQKLLGEATGFTLPAVGARLAQGRHGWHVQVDGHAIPMLAPVDGEVVAVNTDVVGSPVLVNEDPYDRGWLMKVKLPDPAPSRAHLLSGRVAQVWMDEVTERLRETRTGELGLMLPDGGFPVSGIARAMDPERWDRVAREWLLSD